MYINYVIVEFFYIEFIIFFQFFCKFHYLTLCIQFLYTFISVFYTEVSINFYVSNL